MAIIIEKNSVEYITSFSPIRCDTHFKHNIKLADRFFSNENVVWVSLGSVLEKVQNGMNIKTEYYSMEPTDTLYLSVSQIKEYGLIEKNQNFLTDEVKELNSFFELGENTVLTTRSGTIGVALSTNHPSFNFDERTYVASGFVITSKVKKGYSSDVIANYLNLFDVQKYLTAMASGACQKNIAQPIIKNLPIPEILLTDEAEFVGLFKEYETESIKILEDIGMLENQLSELKGDISSSIKDRIISYYS
ncbi:restriction endonuclease subunit S [Mesoflavibacter zeaxanthinifaciens]|uniref:restriction endonuclease subunit S n=1 Tax=Mesoflavibacter zeaxanthinifaciens TaxID=393060 RepID=UPI003A94492A